ncbi:MAG: energy transducer TonB [Phocaeicola vulgatus]
MEVKKTRRADLEKGKSRWLFMGLIVTLLFMFVSFEWTERNVTYTISDLVSDPDFFEELVPVTYNQDKPLLPPPPPVAVDPDELNIVDDNSTEIKGDIAASDPTDAPVIIPIPVEVPEEVVDENVNFGEILNPVVVKSVDPYLDKEAIRVISSMPKWKPGKQRGKAVRVKYTVPVVFRLQN